MHGYDFPRLTVRFQELEELIYICRLMWTQDTPSFEGKHFGISEAAEAAGRNPSDVELSVTIERQLPNTDDKSASFRDDLEHMASLGVRHFVMDFGHPQSTTPVLRFVEQVLKPMKALAR